MVDKPFSDLVESYTVCKYSTSFVVLQQAGSAFGTMDILIPIAIFLTMIVTYTYQYIALGGEEILPETYSQEEKDATLNAFALSLLMTRDHLRYCQVEAKKKKRRIKLVKTNMKAQGIAKGRQQSYDLVPNNPKTFEFHDIYGPERDRITPSQSTASATVPNPQNRRSFASPETRRSIPSDPNSTVNIPKNLLYDLVRILAKDSEYHSNPKKVREILDFYEEYGHESSPAPVTDTDGSGSVNKQSKAVTVGKGDFHQHKTKELETKKRIHYLLNDRFVDSTASATQPSTVLLQTEMDKLLQDEELDDFDEDGDIGNVDDLNV